MTVHGAPVTSLRPDRRNVQRLIWAVVISIVVHLICWGGYKLGNRYQLWDKLPALLQMLTPGFLKKALVQTLPKPPPPEQEPPLMFVNVNPDAATPEAPKNAKYYSSLNSRAANPIPDQDTDTPRIIGEQEVVPDTETVKRQNFDKLQPYVPPQKAEEEERPKAQAKQETGDLAMAKPNLNPQAETGTGEKKRIRRLAELPPSKAPRLPSQAMNQKGGVQVQLDTPGLDTKSTTTGVYDSLFIQAVKARWFDLLSDREYASDARGRVVISFRLQYDGRITDANVVENTVTETLALLCQKAILDPAPFEKWTRDMRLAIGKDYREIKFTFYYY